MNIIEKLSDRGNKSNKPDRLIVHCMSEYLMYEGRKMHASEFLKEIGLSAHYLICPNGDVIKCRKTNQGAYHAKDHNINTVGIEILVEGVHNYEGFLKRIEKPYHTKKQMDSLVELSQDIIDYWGIKKENIIRHSDIDSPRKKDTGKGFPFEEYKSKLK